MTHSLTARNLQWRRRAVGYYEAVGQRYTELPDGSFATTTISLCISHDNGVWRLYAGDSARATRITLRDAKQVAELLFGF